MSQSTGKFFIGTSGWHYKHWVGSFYPDKTPPRKFMQHYLKYFSTTEINASFYRLPAEKTFQTWKDAVPDGFVFSVKASRYITHMKKLKDPHEPLANLFSRADVLEEKLGPILFQLPPGWKLNLDRLHYFLDALPTGYRYALECRNHTWYSEEVYDLLEKKNIAFCIYELEGHVSPFQLTADWVYVRLHGPGGKYEGSYDDKSLNKWAKEIKSWNGKGKDVYLYFDNDQNGYAAQNALRLNQILEKSGATI
ncbi:DUF72 domain-containing protein [Cytophagaceae bacterium ABcell3]|nr:DUF72 domain-containing protein [Cytophagaceae bacterium ABcell3]